MKVLRNLLLFFCFIIISFLSSQPAFASQNASNKPSQNFISTLGDIMGGFFYTVGSFFTQNTVAPVINNNYASLSYDKKMFELMDKKIKELGKTRSQTTVATTTTYTTEAGYVPSASSILPTTTTYNLGSIASPWNDLYVNNLYIPGAGSIGIGTASPGAALDVNGNILLQANGNLDVRSAGGLTIGGATQTGLTLGRSGAQTTINGSSLVFNPTSWTATPSVSGLISANGGLTIASGQAFTLSGFGTTANSVLYANSSGVTTQVGTGTSGYCLVSGTSVPFWQTCPTGSSVWTLANGAVYTTDTTNDLLLGGTSTASATFGFVNVNSGTPTATISGNLVLKVPSGNNKNIQLGVLNGGVLKFQTSVGGDESLSTRLYIGSNGQIGINTTSPTTNLDINGNASASSNLSFNASSTNDTLSILNGSNLKIQTSPGGSGFSTRFYIDSGGNIGVGNSSPTSLFSIGSTSQFQVTSAGIIAAAAGITSSGTIRFSGFSNNGGLLYTDASGNLSQTAIGNLSQCLLSSGGGAPTWGSCGGGGTSNWNLSNGTLFPINSTTDLLVGGAATSSAKFGFINVNSGNPTATIAGNFTLQVPNTANQNVVLGALNGDSFKFQTSVGGDTGLATKLYIANNGNVGVNTTSPTTNFDLNGSASVSGSLLFDKGSSDAQVGSLNGFGIKFQTSPGGSTGLATALYIQNGGNIGVNTLTPSAKFDVNGTASISGQLALYGTPTIQSTANQTLILGGNTTGDIQFKPNNLTSSLYLTSGGNVGIGITLPSATLDVRGNSGTSPVALISGNTSYSSFVVNNNSATGDLFTASASGAPVFTVSNGGNITDTNATSVNFSNAALIVSSCTGCGAATNFWQQTVSGGLTYVSPSPITQLLSVGATTGLTASGLSVKVNSLGNAAAYVENTGNAGDLFTASAAGTTKFRLTNSGAALFQGDMLSSIGSGASGNGSNTVNNNIGDQGSLAPNAGFESNISSSIADGWFPAATASAGVFSRDTTNVVQGNASMKINQTANQVDALYSSCIPLTGDSHAAYELNWFDFGASGTVPTIGGWVDFYSSKANCQADTSPTLLVFAVNQQGSTGSWQRHGSGTSSLTFPNGKTWGRVHFEFSCSSQPCVSNIDGIRLTEKDGGQGLDYAENYPADPQNIPHPGDVVSLSSFHTVAQVAPANLFMEQTIIGVVSTKPGEVLDDGSVPNPKVPIALSGRVPVNVSTKNGAIAIGDYLTSSTIPGVAVRATKPGIVIGRALEPFTSNDQSEVGNVLVLVNASYADPAPQVAITATGDLSIDGQPIGAAIVQSTSSDSAHQTIGNASVDQFNTLSTTVFGLQNQVASLSGQLADLQKTVNSNQLLQEISTASAVLGATTSTNGDLIVDGKLNVLGRTVLSDLGVTGVINTGLLTINGLDTSGATNSATINTLTAPLKFQSLATAGVDFENGRVTIDTNGNIATSGDITGKTVKSEKLQTGSIEITHDTSDDASIGEATIPAGQKSIEVKTTAVTDKSNIFTSPEEPLDFSIGITNQKQSVSFTAIITKPAIHDIKFKWWLVN